MSVEGCGRESAWCRIAGSREVVNNNEEQVVQRSTVCMSSDSGVNRCCVGRRDASSCRVGGSSCLPD
jgi:hypothetical protein